LALFSIRIAGEAVVSASVTLSPTPKEQGTEGALPEHVAGVRSYRDLIAWQLANQFNDQVTSIVRNAPTAWADVRYRAQLLESARAVSKDIAEGFLRFSPKQFARFLDYAVGSLAEAEERLIDGVALGYFDASNCAAALQLARRCLTAAIRLKKSQSRWISKQRS
jgi:four helix bundle protein